MKRKEYHIERTAMGWEVRDRADVFVSAHPTKATAQAKASLLNKLAGF